MEIEELEQELHPFRKRDLPGAEQRPGQRVERAPASPARVLLHPVRPPAVLGYPAASAERALPRKGQSTTKVGLVFFFIVWRFAFCPLSGAFALYHQDRVHRSCAKKDF